MTLYEYSEVANLTKSLSTQIINKDFPSGVSLFIGCESAMNAKSSVMLQFSKV